MKNRSFLLIDYITHAKKTKTTPSQSMKRFLFCKKLKRIMGKLFPDWQRQHLPTLIYQTNQHTKMYW